MLKLLSYTERMYDIMYGFGHHWWILVTVVVIGILGMILAYLFSYNKKHIRKRTIEFKTFGQRAKDIIAYLNTICEEMEIPIISLSIYPACAAHKIVVKCNNEDYYILADKIISAAGENLTSIKY